jgi:hypothetical protein
MKMAYRQITLERLARNDKLARFQTRGQADKFRAMKQQSSSMMRLHQAELTLLIRRTKGKEIRQNDNLVQALARKRNPDKEPSQKGFDDGYKITSRCIAFGSPVANSYAQSSNITSENLITTSIRSRLQAAVIKLKSDAVLSEI